MRRQRGDVFARRFALIEIAILLSASLVFASAGGARADEAFLCGPDDVVYVRLEDLEARKRSDPCIASYFGIKIDEPSKPLGPQARAETTQAGKAQAATIAPGKNIQVAVALKSLTNADVPQRARRKATRGLVVRPVVSAPGTDYRNIHVINAHDSEEEWFRHTR